MISDLTSDLMDIRSDAGSDIEAGIVADIALLANVVFIETEEGLILIDTTESNDALVQIFNEVNFIEKPTKLHTLIYTHHHPDHTFGGLGVYDILNSFGQDRSSLQVIAHDKFHPDP